MTLRSRPTVGDSSALPRIQRPIQSDPEQHVPALDFLTSVSAKVATEMQAVLEAVADAPPSAFSGGGKWETMHGEMAGIYEIRV